MSQLHWDLAAARGLVAAGTWIRYGASNKQMPGICAEEAIEQVGGWAGEGRLWSARTRAMHAALVAAVGDDYAWPSSPPRLLCWNDEPGRTRAQVLHLFDVAIEGAP